MPDKKQRQKRFRSEVLTLREDTRQGFPFYPQDHLAEPGLMLCGPAARGVWWHMVCLMHMSKRRGYLYAGKTPMTRETAPQMLSQSMGLPSLVGHFRNYLSELWKHDVFSITRTGTVYSRRMVRDERTYKAAAEHGKKGGRPKGGVSEVSSSPDPKPQATSSNLQATSLQDVANKSSELVKETELPYRDAVVGKMLSLVKQLSRPMISAACRMMGRDPLKFAAHYYDASNGRDPVALLAVRLRGKGYTPSDRALEWAKASMKNEVPQEVTDILTGKGRKDGTG